MSDPAESRTAPDPFVADLARRIEERNAEWHRIQNRRVALIFGTLVCFTGVMSILRDRHPEVIRMFGESAYLLTFGGVLVLGIWTILDFVREKWG